MVAFSKISMFLGGACALQSQTKDQLAAAKGIIGKKEVAKFGAGMAAFAGIRAGANAIASSTSGLSDSLSESSESSEDAGSRTCHGFIFKRFHFLIIFTRVHHQNLSMTQSYEQTSLW